MKDLTVSLIVNAYAEEFKTWILGLSCRKRNVVEEKIEFGDFARIDGVAVRSIRMNTLPSSTALLKSY